MTRLEIATLLSRLHHELSSEECPSLYHDYGRGPVFIAPHTFMRLPKFRLLALLREALIILSEKEYRLAAWKHARSAEMHITNN